MQSSVTAGHLILVYGESEWYDVDDEKREYYKLCAKMRAEEQICEGVSIMVQPDDLLSRMPSPNKLRAYTYNFPRLIENKFQDALAELIAQYVRPTVCEGDGLSLLQAKAIALKVFG